MKKLIIGLLLGMAIPCWAEFPITIATFENYAANDLWPDPGASAAEPNFNYVEFEPLIFRDIREEYNPDNKYLLSDFVPVNYDAFNYSITWELPNPLMCEGQPPNVMAEFQYQDHRYDVTAELENAYDTFESASIYSIVNTSLTPVFFTFPTYDSGIPSSGVKKISLLFSGSKTYEDITIKMDNLKLLYVTAPVDNFISWGLTKFLFHKSFR